MVRGLVPSSWYDAKKPQNVDTWVRRSCVVADSLIAKWARPGGGFIELVADVDVNGLTFIENERRSPEGFAVVAIGVGMAVGEEGFRGFAERQDEGFAFE